MRIPPVVIICLIGAVAGCAKSDRDEAAESQPSESSPVAEAPKLLLEPIISEPAAPALPPAFADPSAPDVADIKPFRRSESVDDPDVLAPQPLLPSEVAPMLINPPATNRTALQPMPSRSYGPIRTAAKPEPFTTIRVFYGTNRGETESNNPKEMYGSRQGHTTFGFCDVSIPKNHKPGKLESPSIWRFEFREDPEKHVVLLRVLKRSKDDFLSALRQKVWGSMEVVDTPEGPALAGGEVFVFVHGYNNSFEDAARRTAQIAYDLKFRGAPVMYSWPSQAKSSLDAYRRDGQLAGWSEEHLIDFVTTVAKESGARRVHLIAHSMGNRIVSGALRRLVDQCVSGRLPKFNEVILSAPDVDAEYFKTAIAPRIVHSADRITIYSSSRDYALKMSSFFNPQARKRLGEAGDELTVFPEYANIDVIDATEVETDLFSLNHSYHADSPTILADMQLLMAGYSTEQRGLAAAFNRLAWQIRNVGRQLTEGVTPPSRR